MPICLYVHHIYTVPEDGIQIPGAEVISSRDLPDVGAGNQTLALCKSS